MSGLYFIKAPCHQSLRQQGYQNSPDYILPHYDHEINIEEFDGTKLDFYTGNYSICSGYNTLHNYVSSYVRENPDKIPITIGGDNSISLGTVSGMNEKYFNPQNKTSNMYLLYLDVNPDILTIGKCHDLEKIDINDMVVSSLMGLNEVDFINKPKIIDQKKIIYFGLDHSLDLSTVHDHKILHLTNKKIKTTDLNSIVDVVRNLIKENPIYVVLDVKIFDKSIMPSVSNPNENGLSLEVVEKFLAGLKKNICGMDIVEFNPTIGSSKDVNLSKETIKLLLKRLFNIKEKTVNIFSEDSQFLIYRPFDQKDSDTDIGWYILRGMDIKTRESLIKRIDDDQITSLDLEDEDGEEETYLVTKTTMNEQYEKSYFTADNINDAILYPQEKSLMAFELINC